MTRHSYLSISTMKTPIGKITYTLSALLLKLKIWNISTIERVGCANVWCALTHVA